MKSAILAVAFALVALVAAAPKPNPVAKPNPNAVAEPWEFYKASFTVTPTGGPSKKKRGLGSKAVVMARAAHPDDPVPIDLLRPRDASLQKRTTPSPTGGDDANKCGTNNLIAGGLAATCGSGNEGPCCSFYGWCGSNSLYCGGGCQSDYGSCTTPYLQLTYDADPGDSIWDVVSDNVFDAEVGDGIIYYGHEPSGGFPNPPLEKKK